MKKMFKYVPVILGLMMVMSSCGDDDETEPDPAATNPSLTYTVNGTQGSDSYTVNVGDEIRIALTGQRSDKDLDKIKMTQNGDNAITTGVAFTFTSTENSYDLENNIEVSIDNKDDETLLIRDTLTNITGTVGETTYTFTLTENDGSSTSKSFKIIVESPETPLNTTVMGTTYHILGQSRGTWNLTADSAVSSTAIPLLGETFMRNTDAANNYTGAFELLPATRMMVVATSSFDYTSPTQESAKAAYDAGTPVSSIATPTVDAVYIVNLGGDNYAAVKITALDPNDTTGGTAGGNTGKLTFQYKK